MVSNFKHIWLRVCIEGVTPLHRTRHCISSPSIVAVCNQHVLVVFALPYTMFEDRSFACLPVVVSVRMGTNGVGMGATGELLPSLHSCCAISMFWAAAVMMSRMMCDVSVEPHQELPSHLYG